MSCDTPYQEFLIFCPQPTRQWFPNKTVDVDSMSDPGNDCNGAQQCIDIQRAKWLKPKRHNKQKNEKISVSYVSKTIFPFTDKQAFCFFSLVLFDSNFFFIRIVVSLFLFP